MTILKRLLIGIIIFFSACTVFAQTQPDVLYLKLNKSKIDTNRVNILEDLGRYFDGLPDRHIKDIDSSVTFFGKALQLAQQLHTKDKEMEARSLLSGENFVKGDVQSGRRLAVEVIDYYRDTKDLKKQAKYTCQYADNMPSNTPEDLAENIRMYNEAARLFGLIHDDLGKINVARDIARLNLKAGKIDLAEQQYLNVVKLYNAIGYKELVTVYNSLATISVTKGDFKKQLEYPTGLMVASQLSRFNIDFIILDKKPGPTKDSRALLLTPRSLEIYQQLGLVESVLKNGKVVNGFFIFINGRLKASINTTGAGEGVTEFNSLVSFEQWKNEALLYQYLENSGRDVQWSTSFIEMEQDGNSVVVKLIAHANPSQAFSICADYLLACDGASSTVRQSLSCAFKSSQS